MPSKQLDEHTLELLFRSHFTGLCQFAAGYVKDSEAAKEIVQEAFVNLWEKRESIDISKPVKGYLSTTVRNRCLNYLRDHKKFSSELLSVENLAREESYDQHDKMVESDLRRQIGLAIDELPEKCREIFTLSRYRHMKYQQIAGHLQISVKTVETQMSKALQHMRIRLAEYLPLVLFVISLLRYFATSLLFFLSLFRYFAISLLFFLSLFRYFAILLLFFLSLFRYFAISLLFFLSLFRYFAISLLFFLSLFRYFAISLLYYTASG